MELSKFKHIPRRIACEKRVYFECGRRKYRSRCTLLTNVASPIVVPKALKKDQLVDAKDEKKNLFSRLETKNLTFPDGGPQNISRKKRRDDVIKNLMKAGVLDPTTSIPYLEKMFNPGGSYLEIANEKDLEPFNIEESRPQSTSDYQSDDNDSVD